MKSDLRDMKGREIRLGDRLRFRHDYDGCVWLGTVIFEDGMFTIDLTDPKQEINPSEWDQPHDWIKSRGWSSKVGYGEYGTWNCPRQPLTQIADTWKDFEKELQPLLAKFGYLGGRILKVEIVKPTEARKACPGKKNT